MEWIYSVGWSFNFRAFVIIHEFVHCRSRDFHTRCDLICGQVHICWIGLHLEINTFIKVILLSYIRFMLIHIHSNHYLVHLVVGKDLLWWFPYFLHRHLRLTLLKLTLPHWLWHLFTRYSRSTWLTCRVLQSHIWFDFWPGLGPWFSTLVDAWLPIFLLHYPWSFFGWILWLFLSVSKAHLFFQL